MKLIFFDFDGVLVDTLGIAYEINTEADPGLTLEEYKSFFHGNIVNAIKDGRKKAIPDFDEKFTAKSRELIIPEPIKNLITALSKEFILTIVSSSSTNIIEAILNREGMMSHFKDIMGRDVHHSKIEKIKTLLAKYEGEPEDAVFITDTVGDIVEAGKCNVKAIAVTWGFHDEETLQKAHPEKIVNTPEDLAKAIVEILW